ncbi:MAG: glycosyltransferase family 4 protein [Flavobacteriaceae bacterium]
MKNILLIGPLPEPTTGVSLANKVVLENLRDFNVDFINTSFNRFDEGLGEFSFKKAFFYLKINLYVLKIFKSNIVYITPGQTFYGVVKYSLFIIVSHLLNKDIIIHVHGNYLGKQYSELKGLKKRIFKWLLKKTSKGIVLSESLKNNMIPFIDKNKIYVLRNFVEDYVFVNKEKLSNKLLNNHLKIVYLGNLMEEKGIFNLLEALEVLEKEGVKYEAKIAGSIDIKNKERPYGFFSKLKNTEYLGVVKGNEKKNLLAWANIFVLPTYYTMEGQPISILEAMASGNVILTTKHAGIPDIFKDNKNGFFINKKDPNDIVKKIKMIYTNDKIKDIKQNNYYEANQNYKVQTFINNLSLILNA